MRCKISMTQWRHCWVSNSLDSNTSCYSGSYITVQRDVLFSFSFDFLYFTIATRPIPVKLSKQCYVTKRIKCEAKKKKKKRLALYMVRRFSLSRRQSLWIALSSQKRSAEEGDKWVHISSMTWKGSCFALSQCHRDLILMQSLPLQKIPGKKRLISHECSSCQLCLLHKVPGASYSCWWEPNTHARTWEWWTKEKGTQIIWHFSSSG